MAKATPKSLGTAWENILISTANRQGISIIQIPTGCRQLGMRFVNGRMEPRLQRIKSPFDFVGFYNGLGVGFDCKTTDQKTFKHSLIDPNQLAHLTNAGQNANAGYLVYFRPIDQIVFYPWFTLMALQPRASLKPEHGVNIGTLTTFRLDLLFKWEPHEGTIRFIGE